jgi:hypothetical protein
LVKAGDNIVSWIYEVLVKREIFNFWTANKKKRWK